jgi:transposase
MRLELRGSRAYTWKAALDEGGIDALREMPTRGRPARLDDGQLQALGRVLLDRPTDHAFGTGLWTLKRVGVLIERLYGVSVRTGSQGFCGMRHSQMSADFGW